MADVQVIQGGAQIRALQCGGETVNLDDYRDGTLYSLVDFAGLGAPLPRELYLFNYTQGQQVSRSPTMGRRTASIMDTNLPRAYYITNDQEINIAAMWPELFSYTDDTQEGSGGEVNQMAVLPLVSSRSLKFLHFACILRLILGTGTNKPYMDGTFGYFPAATGALFTTCGDSPGGPEVSLGSQGYPGGRMARVADRYVLIDSAERIDARLVFPAAGTPLPAEGDSDALTLPQSLACRVNLRGVRRFPVQGGGA
jgi:hypothetical protein